MNSFVYLLKIKEQKTAFDIIIIAVCNDDKLIFF